MCTCLDEQGVYPEALDKVRDPEIHGIIEGCIRTRKEDRYVLCVIVYLVLNFVMGKDAYFMQH